MPIPKKQPLTEEERKNLLLLIKEAQARGMKLPDEAKQVLVNKKTQQWPLGSNGFFLRDDGQPYNPSPAQDGFIKSTARNVLFYGPRGAGKTGAGTQKALFKIMQGEDGLIMNPDFENLRVSTWPEFKRWIPWNMVVPSQRHRSSNAWQPTQPFVMVFLNGVKVYIKGGRDS